MPLFQKLPAQGSYSKQTFQAIWEIAKVVLETVDFEQATQKVVNIVLGQLGQQRYGYDAIVLTLLDSEKNHLKRIAISKTEKAARFLESSPIPFEDIIIPLYATDNLAVQAINEQKLKITDKMSEILCPGLPEEWVNKFQQEIGTKTGLVFPIMARQKILGALVFSLNKENSKITEDEWIILDAFVGTVGIALDNAILFRSLKESREQLAKANEKLRELDKLKDDFVSVASHELRTPMTAIKSYLWMALNKPILFGKKAGLRSSTSSAGLKQTIGKETAKQAETDLKKMGVELPEDLKRYLSRAYISVERLINLVNDMLNISRIESGRVALRLSEVDLVALAKEVQEEVTAKAKEKAVEVKVVEKVIPKVLCDADKIHEVYLNLVGNSLKFTKAGGTITIDFDRQDPFVYTKVVDTGVGIAPENVSRLFAKFGRLESSYVAVAESGGTGLGLYISKSIVELHKGNINASSEGLGKGSTFAFTLPVAGTELAEDLKHEAPKETEDTKELEKTNINAALN